MHTTSQVKAAPAAQPPIAKPAAQPLMASAVDAVEAPSLTEQMARAQLGHHFGAISVLPPDPPSIQPKRMVASAPRLSAFRPMGQGRVNPAPVIPAGWVVPKVQTKLTVGEPNDPYEQEADRVADQVMRMAEPRVQTKCACGGEAGPDGECAACKTQRLGIQRQAQDEPAQREAVVQAQSDTAPAEASPDLESRLNGSRGSGQALPADTRGAMESAFGADFGGVRVHTGNEAVQMNKALSAQAFTHGSDIYFNAGKYEPGSAEGKGLLAHELTHVVQQHLSLQTAGALLSQPDNISSRLADQGSSQGIIGVPIRKASTAMILRSPEASQLISSNTRWGNLNEASLGRILKQRVLEGSFDFVQDVLNTLGTTDRDDVSYELCHNTTDPELDLISSMQQGRRLLDRLYDELTSGNVAEEENTEADRIMRAKGRNITPSDFENGIHHAKMFPFRLPGFTVLGDAPISAERRANGRVWVKQPVRVLGTNEFRAETQTLPTEVFISGIELPENEIIGVKMYDLGGEVHYRPAIYLIQLANNTDTTIMMKMGEAAALGLTLGTGSLATGGASLAARILIWIDRLAVVLGSLTSIIREHRGWIIERFGERGQTFLLWNDRVSSALAIYGLARAVYGMGQLFNSLRNAYDEWKTFRQAMQLSESETNTVNRLVQHEDEFLNLVERIQSQPPANDNAISNNVIPLRPSGSTVSSTPGMPSTAISGNNALQIAPDVAPSVAPSMIPSPTANPVPSPTPTSAITGNPVSAPTLIPPVNPAIPSLVAPATAPTSQPQNPNQSLQIILVLPAQKAIHANLYRSLINSRRLIHLANNPRTVDAQADRWDRALQPGGVMAIYQEIWNAFDAMLIERNRKLRPNWARGQLNVPMQVDHKVELQVCPPGEEEIWDSFANYELLDASSNMSSGSQLATNIRAERVRLVAITGNPNWMNANLIFTHLIVSTGNRGERWEADQIQQGEHYHALRDLLRETTSGR